MITQEYLDFATGAVREHIIGDAYQHEVRSLLVALESFTGHRTIPVITSTGGALTVLDLNGKKEDSQ